MTMNKLLPILSLLIIVSCSEILDPPKYEIGDCITPLDTAQIGTSYSWFGEYAKIDGFKSKTEDVTGSTYTLFFPTYDSASNLFVTEEIDRETKKVDISYCEK